MSANRTLSSSAYLEILDLYVEKGSSCVFRFTCSGQVDRAAKGKKKRIKAAAPRSHKQTVTRSPGSDHHALDSRDMGKKRDPTILWCQLEREEAGEG